MAATRNDLRLAADGGQTVAECESDGQGSEAPEPGTARVRILVCDDHQLFREGTIRILSDEPAFEVVGDAPSPAAGLSLARRLQPDIVLLDIGFPGGPLGLDAIPQFKEAAPDAHVLIVTMHQNKSFGRAAFERGASGYVSKDAAADTLVKAVRIVALGGHVIPKFLSEKPRGPEIRLTPREEEVLILIASGHTSAETAEQLMLSVRTVEAHRSQLYRKFSVTSRAQLITAARSHGFLS